MNGSELADFIGPVATVLLTVVAAVRPHWRVAIIVIGVIAAVASTLSIEFAHRRESDLRSFTSGGDNFCYLKADLAAAKSIDDQVPWWRVNGKGMPLEKAATWVALYKPNLSRLDPEYQAIQNQPRGFFPCPVSPVWSGIVLGRGHYQIDLSTFERHFIEDLEIAAIDGQLRQSIVVREAEQGMQVVFTTGGFEK